MKKGLQKELKGFTLIELLVVIAIIGILAAVVVTATGAARAKGDNAAIMRGFDTVRKQAEIYFTNNNLKYGTTDLNPSSSISSDCSAASGNLFADPTIVSSITQIGKSSGGNGRGNIACSFNASKNVWAFAVLMKNSGNISGVWCVDSLGGSIKKYPSATTATDVTNVLNMSSISCR